MRTYSMIPHIRDISSMFVVLLALGSAWPQSNAAVMQSAITHGRHLTAASTTPGRCSFNISSDSFSLSCSDENMLSFAISPTFGAGLKHNNVRGAVKDSKDCPPPDSGKLCVVLCINPDVDVVFSSSSVSGSGLKCPDGAVLVVSQGGQVVFQGSQFSHFMGDGGGATLTIMGSSQLALSDCEFSNNTRGLTQRWPPLSPSIMTSARNLTFRGNMVGAFVVQAENPDELENVALDISILASSFKDNGVEGDASDGKGAGIRVSLGKCTSCTLSMSVSNSSFDGNQAVRRGGGIYIDLDDSVDSSATATIVDSRFTRNSAMHGGAFFLGSGDSKGTSITVKLTDVQCVSNQAWGMVRMKVEDPVQGQGGCLTIDITGTKSTSMKLHLNNVVIANNTAVVGGGIEIESYAASSGLIQIHAQGLQMSTNNATMHGGGLYLSVAEASNTNVSFDWKNTIFTSNSADANGGGLFMHGISMHGVGTVGFHTNGVKFVRNRVTGVFGTDSDGYTPLKGTNPYGGGGAIYLAMAESALGVSLAFSGESLVFDSNNAVKSRGGGLHLDASSAHWDGEEGDGTDSLAPAINLSVKRLVFINNKADFAGGGMFVRLSKSPTTFVIGGNGASSIFSDNAAVTGPGGAMQIVLAPVADAVSSSVVLQGCTFTNNSANSSTGGALQVFGNPQNFASDCTTANNCRERVLLLDNNNFSSNYALSGAGVFLLNTTGTINNTSFHANRAESLGGAVYSKACEDMLVVGSSFTNNSASTGGALGGAVGDAQELNNVTIKDSQFYGNVAELDGGALYLAGGSNNLISCVVRFNVAGARGGGVVFASTCGQSSESCCLTIDARNNITNNTAVTGGGVFLALPIATNDTNSVLSASWSWGNSNTAQYAAAVSIAPQKAALKVLQDMPSQVMFPSTTGERGRIPLVVQVGNQSNVRVQVELKDMLSSGQTAIADSVYLTGFVNVTDASGIAMFNDLHIIGGTPLEPEFNAIYSLKVSAPDYTYIQPQVLQAHIRGCVWGEVRTKAPAAVQSTTCDVCLDGSYSSLSKGTECVPCPFGNIATCTSGTILPVNGYWQGGLESDIIQKCTNIGACRGDRDAVLSSMTACINSSECATKCQAYRHCTSACNKTADGNAACWDACAPAGTCLMNCSSTDELQCTQRAFADMFCSKGYVGRLCGVCAPGYGAYKLFRCAKCLPKWLAWILYALAVMLVCGVVLFVSHSVMQSAAQPISVTDIRESDVFKVMTTHLQVLGVISGFLMEWPITLQVLFGAVRFAQGPTETQMASLPCLGVTSSAGQLWLSLSLFIIVSVVCVLAWLAAKYLHNFPNRVFAMSRVRVSHRRVRIPDEPYRSACNEEGEIAPASETEISHLRPTPASEVTEATAHHSKVTQGTHEGWRAMRAHHLLLATGLVSVFFLYTQLVGTSLTPLSCIRVNYSSTSYWALDMSIPCWTKRHLQAGLGPAVVGILLFIIALPAGLVLCRGQIVKHPDSRSSHILFSFLFRQYHPTRQLWELYSCLHNAFIVAVGVFAKGIGAYHQLLLMATLVLLNTLLAHSLQPFRKLLIHRLHLTSVTLVLLTCIMLLAVKDADRVFIAGRDYDKGFTDVQKMLGVVIALLHSTFLVWCVVVMIAVYVHVKGKKDMVSGGSRSWFRCCSLTGCGCRVPGLKWLSVVVLKIAGGESLDAPVSDVSMVPLMGSSQGGQGQVV